MYLTREISKRTNIKKRIHLHGFRHSRATHLAEHLTEQQMKSYLGWTAGSDMAAVYVHLSGKDIDKAIMQMNGIEDLEQPVDSMKPGQCPRCMEMNPPQAVRCMRCGLVLDQATFEQLQRAEEITPQSILAVLQSPEGQALLEKLKK
jgi:rubrerythrin